MSKLSPEEEKKILESPPRATMLLNIILAICFVAGWFYLFEKFLSHGPVN